MTLSQRLQAFARHYAETGNGTTAYLAVAPGVTRRTAANSGSLLLRRDDVRQEVERIRTETDSRSPLDLLRDSDYEALNLWLLGQLLGMLLRPNLTVSETLRIIAACGRFLKRMAKQRPREADCLSPEQLEGLPE